MTWHFHLLVIAKLQANEGHATSKGISHGKINKTETLYEILNSMFLKGLKDNSVVATFQGPTKAIGTLAALLKTLNENY